MAMLVEKYSKRTDGEAPFVLRNFVGSRWRKAISEHEFAIPDPMTGASLCVAPRSQNEDVRAALLALQDAWPYGETSREISVERWSSVLLKWADLIEQHWEALVSIMTDVFPIERSGVEAELTLSVRFMRSWAGNGARWLGEGSFIRGEGGQTVTTMWEPRGICGLITPFNFTMEIPALQIVGALVCQNVLVIKPHELTGAPIQALLELGLAAGLPPEAFCLLHGYGCELALLGTSPDIEFGVFTGSAAVFESIHEGGGSFYRGEVSGIGPAICGPGNWTDDDYDLMAWRADGDRYRRAGQVCARRAVEFLHVSMAERLTTMARERAAVRTLADGTNSPVLSWSSDRLSGRVGELVGHGGEVLFGGNPIAHPYECRLDDPYKRFGYGFFEPTLVRLPMSALGDEATVAALQEECFGPVHAQFVWETESDLAAIRRFVRLNPHKLTAAVVSKDPEFVGGLRRALRKYGVRYWGAGAGPKGAPDWMRFAGAGPLAACIGGRPQDVREVWMNSVEECYRPGRVESDTWTS